MHALTVRPLHAGSARLDDLPEPVAGPGELLVDGLAVGVCGTDREIADGRYGWAPPGRDRLVLGHESLGRVREAPPDSGFTPGDLVVGVVRRPDPQPCGPCGIGEFDMCRNGGYTERGIKQRDGYASQRWTVPTGYAVRVAPQLGDLGVLLEPTSVVAKAWEQVDRIGARSWYRPERVLITGAGPIGMLAALLATQRGLDVHVLDRVDTGLKPAVVGALGATYHHGPAGEICEKLRPDVVIEATGVPGVALGIVGRTGPYGIICLTGVSSTGQHLDIDAGELNRDLVLENDVVVGSVNANLRHYTAAADALARADHRWLAGLVTRRVPLTRFAEALVAQPDEIKTVITLDEDR